MIYEVCVGIDIIKQLHGQKGEKEGHPPIFFWTLLRAASGGWWCLDFLEEGYVAWLLSL